MTRILPSSFFNVDAKTLAINLIGKVLCREVDGKILKARIVETECYMGLIDDACHSFHGKITNRTKPFYLTGGYTYVYLIYGMYNCFNIIANDEKHPEGVLIRAVEPLENIEKIKRLRYLIDDEAKLEMTKAKTNNLTNGPGKLCKALAITRSDNGLKLGKNSKIYIEEDGFEGFSIVKAKRIGVEYAKKSKDELWRFYMKDNPFVSRR